MNSETNIQVFPDGNEVTIRKGEALPVKEPKIINLTGILNSPFRYLEKRIGEIDQKQCHIVVNREKMWISLKVNEANHYATTVGGLLEFHPKYLEFGINDPGKALTNFKMAELFKRNRPSFESMAEAMKLVTELQNFQAKVNKEIEKKDDNRGNKRDLKEQVVSSNLPDRFNLNIPLFKGTPKVKIDVEVQINADDFSCTLVSYAAGDYIEEMRDTEIDKVLTDIRAIAPDIVIIEQ
ncbi:hypothetical protein [Tellurirhabdus bombi]|uniref:hypothetical protein n=1 Tax=Tellurirhabdus bombi TaxID=2907205 RepID=UPI001F3677B7|nr:hypothetical protein [Tellurirhabdus bombi]